MVEPEDFLDYIHELDALVEEDPELLNSEQLRDLMIEDFRVFLWFTWKTAFRFTPHPIQLEFAHLMQMSGDRILMAMRKFGKSIMDGAFISWCLFKDPHFTVLVISANKDRAMEITGMALAIINSCPYLAHMIPSGKDLDGRQAFTVGNRTRVVKEASCVATSITSGNTGSHADLILCDDIEIPKNSDTQVKREDILKGIDEFTYIKNDNATELFIGTPQTEDSVYFKLEATTFYDLYRMPAEYPDFLDEKQMHCLAPHMLKALRADESLVGKPTYPERFTVEALAKERAKSASSYCLQMLLDPSMSDEGKYPLKLRDFIVMDLARTEGPRRVAWNTGSPITTIESVGLGDDRFYEPAFVDYYPTPYEHIIMGIDPAGSGGDQVGYCVAGGIKGNVFITTAGGIDGGHDEATLKKLCAIMIEYSVREIRIEKNFGDGMYAKHLQRVMGSMGLKVGITPITAKGQKEVRIIECLEPALGSHKLIIDTKVARNQVLMGQITKITRDRGSLLLDDQVDAMEICVSGFANSMVLDTDRLVKENEDLEFQDEISGFLNPMGVKKKQASWI